MEGHHDENIVFFGSGDFAYLTLKGLISEGLSIQLVITAPDKPRGRGRKPRPTQVKKLALENNIPVATPTLLSDRAFIEAVKHLNPDFFVLTDYGKIIPSALLEVPSKAPLNIHPSLLPAYRGAAPVERAMMACEEKTGVTIMIMDTGIDTGPILLQREVGIGETETRGELELRLAEVGIELTIKAIKEFDSLSPVPQSEEGASYAPKITKQELWINWSSPASRIVCKINALSPKPGARTYFDGNYIKPLRAKLIKEIIGEPGAITIIGKKRLIVHTPGGSVEILELMPEGRRPMKASEYLSGHSPKRACSKITANTSQKG